MTTVAGAAPCPEPGAAPERSATAEPSAAPEPAASPGPSAVPEPVEGSAPRPAAAGATPVERPRGTIGGGDPSQYVRERSVDGRRDVSYPPAPEPLGVPVYDNHTHLEIEDGPSTGSGTVQGLSLDEQLERALAVGVHGVVQAGGDVDSSRWSAWAARTHPRVLAAVAIHPNEAPVYERAGELDAAIAVIDELAAEPRVRAIGETGLDFFRTEADGIPAQLRSFEAHIALAKKHRIAMQIHDRDAHDAVLETLERVGAPEKTVFHCFSGDAAMARIAADRGYYLSFAGNVTFKNAQNLRDALAVTPRERILVETDAPFLTPAPYRGRPNAPYLIPVTLRFLAAELALDADELGAQVAANTLRVYGAFED